MAREIDNYSKIDFKCTTILNTQFSHISVQITTTIKSAKYIIYKTQDSP